MIRTMPSTFLYTLLALLLPRFATAAEHGVILQYHHVATDTPPSTSISPADFRSHLEYLQDNGFTVIALDQMIESLRNHQQIPDKSVAITFDDGYLSIYEEAFPTLRSFNFPFTVFISTQPIDDRQANFMTWAQIREMADTGVVIANHMVYHPYMLDRLQEESDDAWINRLRAELLSAEERIQANTGESFKYLAYPYGEFDLQIKRMLEQEGFTGIAQNSGAMGFYSDFLALPRYPLGSIYANLETAKIKFDSLAFHVIEQKPENPVTSSTSPGATLRFAEGEYSLDQIGCFANSQRIPMNWIDRDQGLLELVPDQEYNGRRWRYICTAPKPGTGRYFWYSLQWIKPD